METNQNRGGLRYVDWWTVVIYVAMIVAGAFSIYAASYDFDHASIFSFQEFSGKQMLWAGLSLVLGLAILLIDYRLFETYAFPIYVAMLLVLVLTIAIAPNIKGSHSWIVLGPVSLQPAEFAKFATALALAKLFAGYNFTLNAQRINYVKAISIIFLPILLILAQNETGSALVYMSLFFVLYREGMSGFVLLAAMAAVVFFVVAIKFSGSILMDIPLGEVIVMIIIMILMLWMVAAYARRPIEARNLLFWFVGTALVVTVLKFCNIVVNGYLYFGITLGVALAYILAMHLFYRAKRMVHIALSVGVSLIFLFSVNYAFNNVLQPHQQGRIRVALGLDEDLRGAGYNVNQSKIAIGSGGVFGKGFLNGTQTKLRYVPEQHTDFIYCTIGEEQGFMGSAAVLLAFVILILRILSIAERQPTAFGRVYGYCVASYMIFQICVNIGMVIGLCPVIGIPLPFFSYGGSSLWGFTILLFILLRLDASRRERLTN